MKNHVKTIAAFALCLSLAWGISGCSKEVNAAASTEKTITVTGNGTVKATPDIAYIELGARTVGDTALDAKNSNAKIIDNVLKVLGELGISESDIKTSYFYIYPNYDYQNGYEEITGYSVTNMLTVSTRDIDNVTTIIDKAVEAGSNTNNGVNFSLLNPESYYNQALNIALESSKDKATVIAQNIGKSLGSIVSVTEGYSDISYKTYASYDNAAMESMSSTDDSTSISYDNIEITATVTTTFGY